MGAPEFSPCFCFTDPLYSVIGPAFKFLTSPAPTSSGMANPDPPPNSLGLDIVQSEPTSDAQSTLAEPPSPSTQPTTQSFANTTDSVATDTASSPTTPVTGTDNIDKVDDEIKPDVSKKTPYVNPERVKTGGLPRVNLVILTSEPHVLPFLGVVQDKLTDEELAERMARMREQNEKIKQRRLVCRSCVRLASA